MTARTFFQLVGFMLGLMAVFVGWLARRDDIPSLDVFAWVFGVMALVCVVVLPWLLNRVCARKGHFAPDGVCIRCGTATR